jgi:hypothetical protein
MLPEGCSPMSNINVKGHSGGTNVAVRFVLHPEPLFGDAFCPGPSRLVIFTQHSGPNATIAESANGRTFHAVAEVRFRVLRPR